MSSPHQYASGWNDVYERGGSFHACGALRALYDARDAFRLCSTIEEHHSRHQAASQATSLLEEEMEME